MTKREIESGRVDIRLLRVGSPCHAPTYPALYKTSTEKHDKKTSEKYLKLSTDNLTHQRYIWNCQQTILPSFVQNINRETWKKHEKNIKEINRIVNRQSRYNLRFWLSLYFWPKPCQYRLYLISRFPELFICESLQSWPTDQRGPSFSYISFTFKTKFFLLVLDFYQLTQRLKKHANLTNILDWC